mmetsp:Transcript_3305/g.14415  ORF Transcript_3305/g.14415 Transcript_3305/m.14415 type:complete len:216 (-) Transcript_3305:1926-2573(-)
MVAVPRGGFHLRRLRAPVRPGRRDDRPLRRRRLREVITARPRLRVAVVEPALLAPPFPLPSPLILLQRNPSVLLLHVDELLAEPPGLRLRNHGSHLVTLLARVCPIRGRLRYLLLLLAHRVGVNQESQQEREENLRDEHPGDHEHGRGRTLGLHRPVDNVEAVLAGRGDKEGQHRAHKRPERQAPGILVNLKNARSPVQPGTQQSVDQHEDEPHE